MNANHQILKACVIDDDEIFIYGFKKFMEIRGIFADIIEFKNGLEAINYLQDPAYADSLPDIIFVDINMPVMDGWEFTEMFEEIKSRLGKKIPVYLVSSSVDHSDIDRAKKNSAIEDYILKPISETYVEGIINSYQPDFQLRNMN